MPSAHPATPAQAFAPEFARRLTLILTGLAALVAHKLLRNPHLVALIPQIWHRLTRAARRVERLMARLRATPAPHRPAQRDSHRTPRGPRPPTLNVFLIRNIGHQAAAYACQLEALLAEPASAAILAASPGTARILNAVRRLLGLKPTAGPRRAPEPVPTAPPKPARRAAPALVPKPA